MSDCDAQLKLCVLAGQVAFRCQAKTHTALRRFGMAHFSLKELLAKSLEEFTEVSALQPAKYASHGVLSDCQTCFLHQLLDVSVREAEAHSSMSSFYFTEQKANKNSQGRAEPITAVIARDSLSSSHILGREDNSSNSRVCILREFR